MAKYEFKKETRDRVNQIFNDLEDYLKFCKDYGYRYDESDLYSQRNYVWRQYTKFLAGKPIKDNWAAKNTTVVRNSSAV
jgi:hypothetical protein